MATATRDEIKVKSRNWQEIRVACRGVSPLLLHGTTGALKALVDGKQPPTYAETRTDLDEQIADLGAEIKALKAAINKPEPEMTEQERSPIVEKRAQLRALKDVKARALCEDMVYRDHHGQPALPSDMIMACLRDAAKAAKIDRFHSVTNRNGSTLIHAILRIDEPFIALDGDRQWVVDVRTGKQSVGKGRRKQKVVIYRPRFDDWGFTLNLKVDDSLLPAVSPRMIREIFDAAGQEHGLGAFRPGLSADKRGKAQRHNEKVTKEYEKARARGEAVKPLKIYAPGHFGRFIVTDWEVLTPPKKR